MSTFIVKDSAGSTVAGLISFPALDTFLFKASADLQAGTLYSVTATKDIKATDGTSLEVDYTFSFTTKVAVVPLTVIATVPLDKATDVAVGDSVSVQFNKPIDPASVTI